MILFKNTESHLVYFVVAALFVQEVVPDNLPYSRSTPGIQLELQNPFFYEGGEKCDVENGCLSLEVVYEDVEGTNVLGIYNETRIDATTQLGTRIALYVRTYSEFSVYEQYFLDDLDGTSTGNKDGVSSGWPVFRIPTVIEAPGLRYVTPGGYMVGWTLYAQGSIHDDLERFRWGESGGIVGLLLPGGTDGAIESVVMSALTEPMAANVELVEGADVLLQWGVQAQAEAIPRDFSLQFIVASDEISFNRNVIKWGNTLQTFYGTSKLPDFTVDYVGYWTDNGASHYYNPQPYSTYQDMVLGVYDYTVANDIPIKYAQLDSWWYFKGVGDGVKNWTAMPDVFPDGIEFLHSQTGWPILAHNRYFSNDTDYAQQNGGDYPFTIDDTTAKSLPLDKQFWDDLFDEAKAWGLLTYEQDWLDRQYEGTSALHTNITLGASWLDSMGLAAAERDITIQYCMSFPRHFLHSLRLPAVTQIRVSDDYILTPNQWRIGITSLFAHALGLKPCKDNFWTSRENVNVVYNDCEDLSFDDDPNYALRLKHSYLGRKNYTHGGVACVPWTNFGYDAKYPHGEVRTNLCRDPNNERKDIYCYTKADFDIPEEEWEWDFCRPPVCQVDCYKFNGVDYIGYLSVTENGLPCVDWNGEYGLEGAMCRNPTNEEAPWCYVSEDHNERDFCSNKCQEAVEPNSALQSAIATLSAGPVGFGDREQNLNRNLIMKSCRSDGLILKPSKPLTAIDLVFVSTDYREIWTADAFVSDLSFGIIFMAEIDFSFTFTALGLNLESVFASDVVIFQNYPTELSDLEKIEAGESVTLPACGGYLEFCVFYASPLMNVGTSRVALLGETDKWTLVSPQRFKSILFSESEIQITVSGVAGELVSLAFWDEQQDAIFTITCNFSSNDDLVVYISSQECK